MFLLLLVASLVVEAGPRAADVRLDYDLREGDILFQGNAGPQADAIRAATGSPYTHCGVLFRHEGQWFVAEAVQPVTATPLDLWIERGLADSFRAYRLKETPKAEAIIQAREWARRQNGRDYDLKFRWDDGALYCSEFVWKLFRQADVELCKPRKFRDYALEHPAVKAIIDERYGGMRNLPLDEPVVAPGDLVQSTLLAEVPRRQRQGE